MDWKLTKNYMILILIILNIILLCSNLIKPKEYHLSKSQEEAIKIYLEKNNIEISAIIPTTFYPLNSISMKKVRYNEQDLLNIFFKAAEDVTITNDLGSSIFIENNQILTINNGYITFESNEIDDNFSFDEKYVMRLAEEIENSIKDYYGKMYLDRVIENDDYFYITYNQKINGYINFKNYLNIVIYKTGQILVYFNYYEKIENLNENKKICSPDEALYIFANEIRNLYYDKPINIIKIDLGYNLDTSESDYEYIFKPYYRFYIEGVDEAFFVNAYTNTFEFGAVGQ